MPTTLPNQSRADREKQEQATTRTALLRFYGAFGLAVALLIAFETETGMFRGLTAAEAVLAAMATEMAMRETGIVWAGPMF